MKKTELSKLFETKPEKFALKGDELFWDILKEKAKDRELLSPEELEQWIATQHLALTGKEFERFGITHVAQFEHGERGSDIIGGPWWNSTGIPFLQARLYVLSHLDEMVMFLEESDVSYLDEEEWEKAEKEWASYPKDSEEYKKYNVMRLRRNRKLEEEKQLRLENAQKTFKEALKEKEKNRSSKDAVYYETVPPEVLKSAILVFEAGRKRLDEKESFMEIIDQAKDELLKKLNEKYGPIRNNISDAYLCERTNLSRKVWAGIVKQNGTKKRDYLWALTIGLSMNPEMAERLFQSCKLNYIEENLTENEKIRERLFRAWLDNMTRFECDVNSLNEMIYEINEIKKINPPMELLGSKNLLDDEI